jgi:hypothetical protein
MPPSLEAVTDTQPAEIVFQLRNTDPVSSVKNAEIFMDRPNTLQLTAINHTGADQRLVGKDAGVDGSAIYIYLPVSLISLQAVDQIQISDPDSSWTGSIQASQSGKCICLVPNNDMTFRASDSLEFLLKNIASDKKRQALSPVKIKYSNIGELEAPEQFQPLALSAYPTGKPKNLKEAMACSLESDRIFITSDLDNPCTNTLLLNIKNELPHQPLVPEDVAWENASPVLEISFVYGTGRGALTEDVKLDLEHPKDTLYAARNIKVSLGQIYKDKWQVTTPEQEETLVWRVAPIREVCHEVLGFGADANLDIEITGIVTQLRPGHTQMYVQYFNFPGYKDGFFTLDLVKEYPIPRIISFESASSDIALGDSTELLWATASVDYVTLEYVDYEDENRTPRLLSSEEETPKEKRIPRNGLSAPRTSFPVSPRSTTTYTLRAYVKGNQGAPQKVGQEQKTVSVIWPPNVHIDDFTVTPNPFPETPGQGVPVALSWSIRKITRWHKIEASLGQEERLLNGLATETLLQAFKADDAVLKVSDVLDTKLDERTVHIRSLLYRLKDKIENESYRTKHPDRPGGYVISGELSFRSILKKGKAEGQAEYSIRLDMGVIRGIFYGPPHRFPPGGIICGYAVNGYDITLPIEEGALANQMLRFRFNPRTGYIDPVDLNCLFTPALTAEIVDTILMDERKKLLEKATAEDHAAIEQFISRERPIMIQGYSQRLDAKTLPMWTGFDPRIL